MRFLVFFACIILSHSTFAQSNDGKLFEKATKLSMEGKHGEAIDIYKSIEDKGLSSATLHYNMGTSYLNQNEIAYAVLYLEKAHLTDPSNSNIKHNLEVARSKVDSDIIEIPDFILLRIWRKCANVFSPMIWFILQILLGLILVFGAYKWKFAQQSQAKLKGFTTMGITMILLFLSIAFGFTSESMAHQKDVAILMKPGDLRSGADDRSEALTYLSEGVKLKIRDKIGDWYKVQLLNKEEGWVKVADVLLV